MSIRKISTLSIAFFCSFIVFNAIFVQPVFAISCSGGFGMTHSACENNTGCTWIGIIGADGKPSDVDGTCQAKTKAGTTGDSIGIINPAISEKLGQKPDESNNGTTFSYYFVTVWRALIIVGGLATLFNLVTGALEWITAGGEQTKVQHSRNRMMEGLFGLAILVGSFAIIQVLGSIFKFDILKITFPTP